MHEEAITTTAASTGSNANNVHQSSDNSGTTTISIVHHFQRVNSYDATDTATTTTNAFSTNQIIQPSQTKIILSNVNDIRHTEDDEEAVSSLILSSIANNPNVSNVLIVGTNSCDNTGKGELSLDELASPVEQMEAEIGEIQADGSDKVAAAEGELADKNLSFF